MYGVLKSSKVDELPQNEEVDHEHLVPERQPVFDSYGRLQQAEQQKDGGGCVEAARVVKSDS